LIIMICCNSITEEYKKNKEISMILKKDILKFERTITLLLLGPGESGKSTFFKQMKVIHSGYSDEEIQYFKKFVYSNIVGNAVSLIEASKKLDIHLCPNIEESAMKICSPDLDLSRGITHILTDLINIWNDEGIKQCFSRSTEFHLSDSCE